MKTHMNALVLMLSLALPIAAHAHGHAIDCETHGMDMSKMSAEEQQKFKDQCEAQKHGQDMCDMSAMDMSKMSDADQQKMMAQCHEQDAPPATGAAATMPKEGS